MTHSRSGQICAASWLNPMGGLSLVLALSVGAVVAMPASATAKPAAASSKAAIYTFAFKEADISLVAEEVLGRGLGVTYLVDPDVTGKMSFRIDQRLTPSQLLEAFEAALSANEVVIVRQGETLVLKPQSKAKEGAPLRGPGETVHRSGYEVVAVPLSYASASEVSKALEAISPGKMVLYANDKTGLILIGGSGQELTSALQSIKLFDQNGLADNKIRWFELTKAPASTVFEDLRKVLDASGVGGVSIVPLKRLNGLFVFARTSEALDQTAQWVERLDVASKEQSASLWTYHARNVAAEDLAQTLGGLLGDTGSATSQGPQNGQTPSPLRSSTGGLATGLAGTGGAGGSNLSTSSGFGSGVTPSQTSAVRGVSGTLSGTPDGSPVKVSIDRSSNTLLISASAADWLAIQKMLDEIDHAPAQILIEASILEVTLTKDFKFGVDWSVLGGNGRFKASNLTQGATSVSAKAPGFAITYVDSSIQAAINSLDSQTAVEVISAPKIIALDNHSATLQVGDQVPIITQSQQSTATSTAPLVNSVDYRNTGVIMSVTPRVTGEDKISLTISQEVSSVSQTTSSGINSPTIQQRRFDSALILNNGGVIALGGLISSSKTTGQSGFPVLQRVPGVGALFRGKSNSDQRTELIILLSAKIIRSSDDASRVMSDLLADMSEVKIRGLERRH